MKKATSKNDTYHIRTMSFMGMLIFITAILLPSSIYAQSKSLVRELQNAYQEIASEVIPVVVQVNTVNVIEQNRMNPFQFFFRSPNKSEKDLFDNAPFRQRGLGSGVIVQRQKNVIYVLTNNHVVDNADEIEIVLSDERKFKGKIVGGDALRDLALVSFTTKENVPIAKLGNSGKVQVGDLVLTVGSPMGFESTVTSGIISAKGRTTEGQRFSDYLQTDAAINRGNSGGALVNIDGEVIGINSFIASTSGGSIGLGFALPINNARKAIKNFIEKGDVEYAWLGVNMADLSDVLAEELDLKNKTGAFVYNVYGKSPAQKGGIQPGDLIIKVGEQEIKDADDLSRAIASKDSGQKIPISLIRKGKSVVLKVNLAVRTIEKEGLKVNVWPGFAVVPVTKELRGQLGISRNAGDVMIGSVVRDSPAAALGLRSGDVIKSINGKSVKNLKRFYELVNSDDSIKLRIVRQDEELDFTLNM